MANDSNHALIAASQASEAVAELLRFHREGPQAWSAFGDIEVVCNLAEALKLACEIEAYHLPDHHAPVLSSELGQLAAACACYIERWAL
ncbi:hypothetical protein [Novosphingobium colocasiae]|uniref:hypothetical protein n=1 Tax=Novosphingobium colocasiae TaxID=1256513 RepID=UPI0035ADE5D6